MPKKAGMKSCKKKRRQEYMEGNKEQIGCAYQMEGIEE